jgi:predicted dehydrogenase
MNDIIRIGIVGAGTNTKARHIPGFQAIEGVEIVSVCNRSLASSSKVAEEFKIPKVYENWLELVQSPDSDAILIGTWPNLHHPITIAALDAGKHVLCEARMARDAAEARQMLQAAAAKPQLVAQIVPAPFTFQVDQTVKRLIAEGYLGEILAVEIQDIRGFLDKDSALTWRQDFDLSGYNTMTLGIWVETLLRWVGPATRVAAMGKTFVKMRPDPETGRMRAVRIPEHLDVIAALACGAQAHFGLSQVCGFGDSFGISLFGSRGTLQFKDGKLFGGQVGGLGLTEIKIPPHEQGGWRVEEEFINAIRGLEKVSHTTFEDGLKYMQFTEAVTRSIQEGRSIVLPL